MSSFSNSDLWCGLYSQLIGTLVTVVMIPFVYSAIQSNLQQVKLEDTTFQKALTEVSKTLCYVNNFYQYSLWEKMDFYQRRKFKYPLKRGIGSLDNIVPDSLKDALIDYLDVNTTSDPLFLKIHRVIDCRRNLKEAILEFNKCVDNAFADYLSYEEVEIMNAQPTEITKANKQQRIHIHLPKIAFDQLLQLFFDYFKALSELLVLIWNERKYKQFMSFSLYYKIRYFKCFPIDRKTSNANLNELQQFLSEIKAPQKAS